MKIQGEFIKKISKSELFRNISTLVAGTALAQLIPIILQPVLRRFYTPEFYGAYAVYMSLVGILFIISSFRYELAILHPRKDKEAVNVFFLAQSLNFIFTIILLGVLIVFKSRISTFLNIPEKYSFLILFVPLGTYLYNLYQSLNYWLIRKKKFIAISVNKFIRRSTEGALQTGLRYFFMNAGLVIGDLSGHVANILSGLGQTTRAGLTPSQISIPKIRYVARKYIEYPKYNMSSTFLSACSYLVPAILINKFFGPEFTGFFDLSKLVLSIPLALLAGSIANVLLQRITEKYTAEDSIVRDIYSILSVVIIIAVLEILVIRLYSVELFTFFFGKQWTMSGEISGILVWSFTMNFIIFSFNTVFISLKKIRLFSIWQVFYFACISSLVLFRHLEFTRFIRLYVGIELLCYTLNILLLVFIVSRYESRIRKGKANGKQADSSNSLRS